MSLFDGAIGIATLWLIAWVSGAFVCTSAAVLFWVTYYRERKLKAPWRLVGFTGLAITFVLYVIGNWVPEITTQALLLEPFAFFLVYLGVHYEPMLSHLRKIATYEERQEARQSNRQPSIIHDIGLHTLSGLIIALALVVSLVASMQIVQIASHAMSSVVVAATMYLQLRRLVGEKDGRQTKLQNLYPLIGYVFLLGYSLVATMQPIVSTVEALAPVSLFMAMIFLAAWAWVFIQARSHLRTSIISFGVLATLSAVSIFALTYAVSKFLQIIISSLNP